MTKFLFTYHGGAMAPTPEAQAKTMEAWGGWFGKLGAAIVDGGAPTGASSTVTASDVNSGGGSNPVTGYSVIQAENLAAAAALAKGCPIFPDGTVEVSEILAM